MRWTNFVPLGAAFWLSCLGSGYASVLSEEGIAVKQVPPQPFGYYVYRGDVRSPQEIRGDGGFRPQGDGWENHESSFDLVRHYGAGPEGCGLDDEPDDGSENFVFRTAYVSASPRQGTAEMYGNWLYEFRATPNILDNGDNEAEVMALGGIHWRQIRRYTRMRDTPDNRVDETAWIENPEYDRATYEDGPDVGRCHVSTDFPRVLAGEPDSSDSGSDSEDGGGAAGPQRRLFNAAGIFMDREPGMWGLYGEFPPRFTQYAPREDIPGQDHPVPPESVEAQVGRQLQHYIDMGRQELDRQFPEGDEILRDILRDINDAVCPITGFGSHSGRSEVGFSQRARRAVAKPVCCKILSSFRKKTKGKVELCANSPFNPPCTTVKAPSGKCVAVPQDYEEVVSGVKPHGAGICRFYLESGCKGEYFEADRHAIDLYKSRTKFNDGVASFLCDTAEPKPAPEPWEWTPQSRDQLCSRLDKLTLDFELANYGGAGTWDKIKLGFEGVGQKPHVITEGPAAGFKATQNINMADVFGTDTVALDQIKRLRLLDEMTNWSFGGDKWDIFGLKLRGRCAGSKIHVALDKFSSLNRELQADPFGPEQYHKDWEVWADDVRPDDWAAHPPCSHFDKMSLNLRIADADWAGTDNSLYAKAGKGSFLIARKPYRKEVFTIDFTARQAFGTDVVAVGEVGSVGIASERGYDAALPEEVTVYGFCAGTLSVLPLGKEITVLSVTQKFTDWLYDGKQFNIDLAPEKWKKVQKH